MFVGLVNRERRIRARREALEDQEAAKKTWLEQFKLKNETEMENWQTQNEITNRQQIEQEDRAAKRAAIATAEDRAFQLDLRKLDQNWWKEQQKILNEKSSSQRSIHCNMYGEYINANTATVTV